MTIYLDAIWFLNFCIDFLLLWITAIALKRTIVKWRIVVASFVASTIVLFLFTPFSTLFYQPVIKIVFSMFIVLIAFGFKRLHFFIQNVFMFYFVTFMTGGGLVAFHYFWQTDVELLNGVMLTKVTGFGSTFSWVFVVIGFPLLWYFSKQQLQQIEGRKMQYEKIVEVEVAVEERKIVVKGLIDNGNQLHDPLTKAPVMILEGRVLMEMFPDLEIEQYTSSNLMDNFHLVQDDNNPLLHRLRIIPFKAVGKGQDYLIAFKPDYVKVIEQGQELINKKVLVGIQQMVLSNDGDFQAIIHPKMMMSTYNEKLA